MTLLRWFSAVAFVEDEGVVHAVQWSDDDELVFVCLGRKLPSNIQPWNPYHPDNVGKPKHLTCMGCIAEEGAMEDGR